MLLRRHLRNPNPKLHSRSAPLPSSHFTTSSQTTPATAGPPPRKGRQAVRRLLKLLSSPSPSQNAPDPDLSHALDALKNSPTTLSAASAAALISAAGDPLLSFDFYRFLKSSKPLFRPDPPLFASLLKTQLHSRSPAPFRIRFYLDEMRKRGLSFSPAEYHSLLSPLLPSKPDLARSFLDHSIDSLGPDSGVYAGAISAFVDKGLVFEAVKVSTRAMSQMGSLDSQFYSSLMGLYEATGDAKAAMEAFLVMEDKGVLADEGVYRALMRVLCRAGWVKLCWVVLEEMTKRFGFGPEEALGLDLMRGLLKQGMISEAGTLFRDGILKDKESFSSFAEEMAEMRMPIEAFELLKTVTKPELYASALIRGCRKMGLIEEAEKIFAEIKSRMELVDSVYPSMIHVYSKAGLRRSAELVWEEMEASGVFSSEACLHLMEMYGETGQLDSARKMFDKLQQIGVCLNAEVYAVLMKALIKAGKIGEARRHLSEMGRQGVSPGCSIYALLMEGYLRAGLLNHAGALLQEYEMLGLGVENAAIATSVAEILVRMGRYAELLRYLDGFERRGIKLSRERREDLIGSCRDESCLKKIACLIQ